MSKKRNNTEVTETKETMEPTTEKTTSENQSNTEVTETKESKKDKMIKKQLEQAKKAQILIMKSMGMSDEEIELKLIELEQATKSAIVSETKTRTRQNGADYLIYKENFKDSKFNKKAIADRLKTSQGAVNQRIGTFFEYLISNNQAIADAVQAYFDSLV